MNRGLDPPDRNEERLADYREGRMSPDQRRAFEEEILEDDTLAAALYADINLDVMIRQAPRRLARPWRWVLPLAAGVALLLTLPQFFRERPDEPRMRGDVPAVRYVSPAGPVPEFPRRYVWTRDALAVRYRFELYDKESKLIFQALVPDTLFDLTEAAMASPGQDSGSWRAVPVDRAGFERPTPPPASFRAVAP